MNIPKPPKSPPKSPPKNQMEQPTVMGMKSPLRDAVKTARFDVSAQKTSTMYCFFQSDNKWQKKQFSSRTSSIKVGSSSNCQININSQEIDDIQLIIERIENQWYVMECGKNDLMRANGILTHQIILKDHELCVLQIGTHFIVLSTKEEPEKSAKLRKELPSPTEMCFSFTDEEQYPFPPDYCLIGANSFCNLITNSKEFLNNITAEEDISFFEKPFIALIFKYKNRLFLQGFDENVKLNNVPAMNEPLLLPQESQITFSNTALNLRLPPSVSQAPDVVLPPLPETIFSMLPAIDPERELPELHIPVSARSVTIGRSGKKADIIINDINISRQHAQFIVYPKNMMVYDCGSSNGTFVNDEKIIKKTIRPGDKISFGDIVYYFCYAEE